ncbi:MAG: DNA-binding response regulator, partial [Thermus sp.]
MPRLLLVEDDPGVREALELGLSLFGYEVVAVGTALEALDRLPGVDLVVLDVLLPDRDGFQLLREIRARSDLPVLMLSALGEVEWRVKGLQEGADDYLAKPYSL